MKHRKKQSRSVAWIILALSMCAMAIFGYQLRAIRQSYQIGAESYKKLSDQVRSDRLHAFSLPHSARGLLSGSGAETENPEEQGKNLETLEIPNMAIDFETLQMINPDAVAWLYGPGTPIDYPVMRAAEYDYYLHHLPNGEYNANGSLFIDYNWADFTDKLTIIYGHNMKSEQMFGSLANYKKQAYFEEHPCLYLYTAGGESYSIELVYGCIMGVGEWRDRAFMFEAN
ncbi:MAG: class B sortase, partial [Oscillospiraceae bacterium]|nr:class B sortase [Oscillospiraceae bacterium]